MAEVIDCQSALDLLHQAVVPGGLLASIVDQDNYRRIWARDGIICGLAGLIAGDPLISRALRETLLTLARCQGPEGQIPSNVKSDSAGKVLEISYGGRCGRVDTIPWFIIGLSNYVLSTGERELSDQLTPQVEQALRLLKAWEFNGRGLIYMPLGGDWADEFIYHGYVLLSQLLRLWALRCWGELSSCDACRQEASALADLIRATYYPGHDTLEQSYHPIAQKLYLENQGPARFLLPALTPGSYQREFDFFSNALGVLLGVLPAEENTRLLRFGEEIRGGRPIRITPAFWPPVTEADPRWEELQSNRLGELRNRPYEYHNGGLWPMLSGWWGCALAAAAQAQAARDLFQELQRFNYQKTAAGMGGFFECGNALTGEPTGTPLCSWSAAAELLLSAALAGRRLRGWAAKAEQVVEVEPAAVKNRSLPGN